MPQQQFSTFGVLAWIVANAGADFISAPFVVHRLDGDRARSRCSRGPAKAQVGQRAPAITGGKNRWLLSLAQLRGARIHRRPREGSRSALRPLA